MNGFRGFVCMIATTILVAAFWPACVCRADDDGPIWKKLTLRPSAGLYLPGSDKVKSRFGDSWTSLGVSLALKGDERARGGLHLSADSITKSSGGDHAYMFPLGMSYTHMLSKSSVLSPYIGAGANLYVIDIKSQADGVDTGLRSGGLGGSMFAGVRIGRGLTMEAIYYAVPEIKGFDMSGLSLSMSYKF